MGVIQAREFDTFLIDVLPYVHLSPVADRENAEVLARVLHSVVDVPEFRTLVLGIPLTEFVAVREDSLLGACLLFITSGSAASCIELVFRQCIQQSDCLEFVSAGIETCLLLYFTFVNRVLDIAYDEVSAKFFHEVIAICDGLREVVTCVDMD